MVLARPAASVTVISARGRWRSNQRLSVANAGSYRTAAIASPSPIQIRRYAATVVTWDHAQTRVAAASEPALIRARPPCRSSQRPTGIDASAWTSRPSEKPPNTTSRDQPSSRSIGSASTPIA